MKDGYSTQDFYDRFTKVDDALKFIDEIEKIDLSQVTDLELEKNIDERFHIFPFVSAKIPKGAELFRARVNINQKPFVYVDDIFLPPKDKIAKYGRANKPNEQVFYCASNYELAIFEVIQNLKYSITPQKEVVTLTIGVWKTNVELHVTNIIHSPKLHQIRQDIKGHYEETQKFLTKGHMPNELLTANNLLCQFFADQFTKDDIKSHFDYRISALYARRLRLANSFIAHQFKNEAFDGINYPSVAMKFKGDNQALFFETAKNKIDLVNAIEVICGNINFANGTLVSGVLHEAEKIESGIITWKEEIYRPKEKY